jgi:hypothetical protein
MTSTEAHTEILADSFAVNIPAGNFLNINMMLFSG